MNNVEIDVRDLQLLPGEEVALGKPGCRLSCSVTCDVTCGITG